MAPKVGAGRGMGRGLTVSKGSPSRPGPSGDSQSSEEDAGK